MAWYPLAKKRVIAPGPNDPPIQIIGAILHVDAGNSPDLYEYFSSSAANGVESHFHIPKAGPVIQMRDTHYEADANLKGNSFTASNGQRYGYASIETQGLEKGEWNAHQVANIKAVLKWLSETHNFPLRRCKSPTHPGVGFHIMFGAPGAWTPVSKSCPGPDRIRQFEQVLVPWFNAGAPSGGAVPNGDDEVITEEDAAKIAAATAKGVEEGLRAYGKALFKDGEGTADALWDQSRANHAALLGKLDALIRAVGGDTAKTAPAPKPAAKAVAK